MTTSRFPNSPSIYASPAQGENSGSLSHNSLLDGSWGLVRGRCGFLGAAVMHSLYLHLTPSYSGVGTSLLHRTQVPPPSRSPGFHL